MDLKPTEKRQFWEVSKPLITGPRANFASLSTAWEIEFPDRAGSRLSGGEECAAWTDKEPVALGSSARGSSDAEERAGFNQHGPGADILNAKDVDPPNNTALEECSPVVPRILRQCNARR